MNILLHVFSNSEYQDDSGDYDYAVLRLTAETAKQISRELLDIRELRRTREDLVHLLFDGSDDLLSFYSNDIFTKNEKNIVDATVDKLSLAAVLSPEEFKHWEENMWCVLRDDFILPPEEEESPYSDCYRTIHAEETFWWEVHSAHLMLETYVLGHEVLDLVK